MICKSHLLDLAVGTGSIVVDQNGDIEFNDISKLSLEQLRYIIDEANCFIVYRNSRLEAPEVH